MPDPVDFGFTGSNRTNRIRNAIIQEIRHRQNVSYVTVTYLPTTPGSRTDTLVLIISRQTVIRNNYGGNINRRSLQVGMTIDAIISNVMTASIPPQTQAIQITVIPARSSYHVKMGVIFQVNRNTRQILVGAIRNPSNAIRLNITQNTRILNSRRQPVNFNALQRGQLVRVDHSTNQTFSIPPQANAYRIWIL